MKCKGLLVGGSIAAAVATAGIASAGLQLSINGDKVTGPEELVKFEYFPASKRLVLESFFKDLRCSPDAAVSGTFELVLDKLNDAELEAEYAIPADAQITYSVDELGNPVVSIVSASIEKLDGEPVSCEHIFPIHGVLQANGSPTRDTFTLGDYESVFDVEVTAPQAPAIGFDVKVSNRDDFFVGRNLIVDFTATSSPQPAYSIAGNASSTPTITVNGWLIPELWPRESITLQIRYSGLVSGQISLSIDDVTSQNRTETLLAPGLITVVNTSTSQVIG